MWRHLWQLVLHCLRYRYYLPLSIKIMANALKCSRLSATSIYMRSVYGADRDHAAFSRLCKDGRLLQAANAVQLEGAEFLHELTSTKRPIMLATIHMGQFQLGMLQLLQKFKPEKRICIFKLNSSDDNERILLSSISTLGYKADVYRVHQDGGREAFMALRRGDIVVLAIDLEVNVRSRSAVTLMEHSCAMQNGPASLAIMTNALIVPVVAMRNPEGGNLLKIDPVIDCADPRWGQTSAERVDRITQSLAINMEAWIRCSPSALHLWGAVAQTLGNSQQHDSAP